MPIGKLCKAVHAQKETRPKGRVNIDLWQIPGAGTKTALC